MVVLNALYPMGEGGVDKKYVYFYYSYDYMIQIWICVYSLACIGDGFLLYPVHVPVYTSKPSPDWVSNTCKCLIYMIVCLTYMCYHTKTISQPDQKIDN